jgi:outer membrane protein assembly factor BamB
VRTFAAATGTPGWVNDKLSSYPVESIPTAVNGLLYVNTGYGLYAVDEVSGNTVWTVPAVQAEEGAPAVSSDGVFTSFGCSAYKLDPFSGSVLWHFQTQCSGTGGPTPVYANGALYARGIYDPTSGATSARVLDAATGAQLGTFAADVAPAFSDSAAFFLSAGTLSASSLSTGATLWTFTGDGQLNSAPLVIDSAVVVASASGMVYALDATTGAVLWSSSAGGPIVASEVLTSLPPVGLGAGEGYLVVPAGNVVTGWRIIP